jgi:hypothetical protein
MRNFNIWKLFFCSSLFFFSCSPSAQLKKSLLRDPLIYNVLNNPKFEAQVLYTHVDLKDTSFSSVNINLNDRYFYPASTVKLPVAILALQYINELKAQGLDIDKSDALLHFARRPEQSNALEDSTTLSRLPTIERYIEKVFAVSDNDAYNRLYEWLGPDYINSSLIKKKVFTDSRICHRVGVGGYSADNNLYTTESIVQRNESIVLRKKVEKAKNTWNHNRSNALKGRGYIDNRDSLVLSPFDFSRKNYYSLTDLETTLKSVIFPQKFKKNNRFNLTDNDYTFLRKVLSDFPSAYPFYKDTIEYYNTYVKFLYYGSDPKAVINPDLKIYNKVGNAYGYLIDCAYFENQKEGIGFFLTAVIHVNTNEIYNDGIYEYNEIGYPFMRQLGKSIYDYELINKKK